MAVNPMQRKSRNSFLAGMFLMLILSAIVIGFILWQNIQKEKEKEEIIYVEVSALNQDVKSGQVLTEDMFTQTLIDSSLVPTNIMTVEDLAIFSLADEYGNKFKTDKNKNEALYILNGNEKTYVEQIGNDFYKEGTEYKINVKNVPIISKLDLRAQTIVTTSMVVLSDEKISTDTRTQEYNMISLPTKLDIGEYIDIRLQLPTGQDYIVLSKQKVIDTDKERVCLELDEDEILTMSNAIIESYIVRGSKLYATRYIEPGNQAEATPTYPVSNNVKVLIERDPNILEEAKNALRSRYDSEQRELVIENVLNGYATESKGNIESRISEEISKQKESRSSYLEELEDASAVQ